MSPLLLFLAALQTILVQFRASVAKFRFSVLRENGCHPEAVRIWTPVARTKIAMDWLEVTWNSALCAALYLDRKKSATTLVDGTETPSAAPPSFWRSK